MQGTAILPSGDFAVGLSRLRDCVFACERNDTPQLGIKPFLPS